MMEEGVLILEGGRIAGGNPALWRLARAGPGGLVGRPLGDLLTDAEGRPVDGGAPASACRLRDARGDLRPVSVVQAGARALLVRDRTRERRLEAEVFRLSNELAPTPLQAPGDGLPSAEVCGMIEHEIRTATTVVNGYLRLLQDGRVGALNPAQTGFLREMRRATDRISSLLDNLLEVAALDGPSGVRVLRKPIRLNEVLRSAVDAMRPLLDDRRVAVELELEAEADALAGDFERLEQVFVNLLANAAKFGPAGSAVRMITRSLPADREIEVAVVDQGPGVEWDERERIFQPFARGSAAERVGAPGVGLGLAICRRIVDAHGGRIEAVPGSGRGLFRVSLPCAAGGDPA